MLKEKSLEFSLFNIIGVMKKMNENELIKKHKKERCDKCNLNTDCEIHIMINNKTRCTYDELLESKRNKRND